MHEVGRMVATWREIFMNRLSGKLPVSESVIARALNCVPRIFGDFKAYHFQTKNTVEIEVSNKAKHSKTLLPKTDKEFQKHLYSSIKIFAISKL